MTDLSNIFLEKLQVAETRQDIQLAVESLRELYGLEHAVYHAINLGGSPYAALTYDHEWSDHYHESGYARIDPVVQGLMRRFHPADWRKLDWSGQSARMLLSEAIDGGVGTQGFSVPVRGVGGQFALFTVNGNHNDQSWSHLIKEFGRDFLLISHYIHQAVLRIEDLDDKYEGRPLSPREQDALSMLANGRSRSRVAESLSISEHTLRVYVDGARFKLGAANTTHAVALALSRGLIAI